MSVDASMSALVSFSSVVKKTCVPVAEAPAKLAPYGPLGEVGLVEINVVSPPQFW